MSIVLEAVQKHYGTVSALHDVDITIERNSLVALLGPSGCGKTTLLRIVAGFDRPDRGRVRIGGVDVTDVPAQRRGIGFVAQNYALFPHMTVARNIAFALDVRGVASDRVAARVGELLALIRLEGYGSRLPRELSGGQKQRVALARALAAEPAILLLDEPFAALDVHVRRELRGWLRDLHDRTQTTTVLVTHDADEAMEVADRIVLLEDGAVIQSGTANELYRAPRSPFAMQFLGTANEFTSDGQATLYVRPHEFIVEPAAFRGSVAASVRRVVALGSRVQLDVVTGDGRRLTAEISESEARRIAPAVGNAIFLAPRRSHSFAAAG